MFDPPDGSSKRRVNNWNIGIHQTFGIWVCPRMGAYPNLWQFQSFLEILEG